MVSGGFTVEKIRAFEEAGVPADSYGVGSSLFPGRFDLTADIVSLNGAPQSKAGRRAMPNPRLELVD
jgi:nicotinate phosphoribosyltransferase